MGRGAVAAAVATLVAALSHTIAGGAPPSWFGLVITFVLTASAGSVLAGRTVSWWRLTASVGLGQAMFHTLFAGMATPAPVAHDHTTAFMATPPHDHGMVWAHVVAGVLTIVALRYGEQAFWSLAGALRFVTHAIDVPIIGLSSGPLQAPPAPRLRTLGIPLPVPRRGPPFEFA